MARWSERQRALLRAIGIRLWPAPERAGTEPAAAALEPSASELGIAALASEAGVAANIGNQERSLNRAGRIALDPAEATACAGWEVAHLVNDPLQFQFLQDAHARRDLAGLNASARLNGC